MPYIFYKDTKFNRSSWAIISHANELIESYAEQGLILTLRQLYYRFVAAGLLPNSLKSYTKLGTVISNARLAGVMDWSAIEDRGRSLKSLSHWDSPADIIRSAAHSYRTDKWVDQEWRVEVWVEKQALEAVVGQAADAFDCPYFSCKGYTSQSEMWRASERFKGYAEEGQKCVLIHLGDHDPSGIDMTRDIDDRLNDLFGATVKVRRIALNMDQIREYDPPPNPAKLTDSRSGDYIANFGSSSWELDALEPAVLQALIRREILAHRDEELYQVQEQIEEAERQLVIQASERWEEVLALLKSKKKPTKK